MSKPYAVTPSTRATHALSIPIPGPLSPTPLRCLLAALLIAALLLPTLKPAQAENWPNWRGPHFDGSTSETGLPDHWGPTENVAWKAPLPGPSSSTPVIWGDYVFLPSAGDKDNLVLVCLDARDGSLRWQKTIGGGNRTLSKNNMASPSAATDGKVVVALLGTGRLAAYDFAGTQLWSRDLARQYGKFAIKFMYASSPVLFGGKLYVQVLQIDRPEVYEHAIDDKPTRQSFLLCLDPKSGETLWRQVRPTDALDESHDAYNTPVPYTGRHGSQIVCYGGDYVTGHNPDTGAELWRCGSLNEKKNTQWRTISSAVAAGELIICCLPRAKSPLVAVSAESTGRVPSSAAVWRFTGGSSDVPTPLCYRGKLYLLDDVKNTLICLDPQTGMQKWSGRLGTPETFSASPTGADGKIYCLGERGTVVVLSAGDEFRVISKFSMPKDAPPDGSSTTSSSAAEPRATRSPGAGLLSSIAAANGHLFIRTPHSLWCIGTKR